MVISSQFLTNVASLNQYSVSPVLTLQDSANQILYFQLIDQSQYLEGGEFQPFNPAAPSTNATAVITWAGQVTSDVITVTIANIATFTQTIAGAFQPFVKLLATQINMDPKASLLFNASAVGGVLTLVGNNTGNVGNYVPITATTTSLSGGTVTPDVLFYPTGGLAGLGGQGINVTFLNINCAPCWPGPFRPPGNGRPPYPGYPFPGYYPYPDTHPVQFTRFAYNPFPQDQSIWAVNILQTDPLHGTPQLQFHMTLSDGSFYTWKIQNQLRINTSRSPWGINSSGPGAGFPYQF